MSNKPEDFVDYFKIKWSRKSLWSIEQFAYLSVGKDPEGEKVEISADATNAISRRYYWLINKLNKREIHVTDTVDGVDYFNTGSLVRKLEEKFELDKHMKKCFDHMYKAPFGIDYSNFVSKSVYREAGRLVFEKYPTATKGQVAAILIDLPAYYNNEEFGHIFSLPKKSIEEYLKNLNTLNQKPSKANKPDLEVCLQQVVENM